MDPCLCSLLHLSSYWHGVSSSQVHLRGELTQRSLQTSTSTFPLLIVAGGALYFCGAAPCRVCCILRMGRDPEYVRSPCHSSSRIRGSFRNRF
jgi:hypothetical protein